MKSIKRELKLLLDNKISWIDNIGYSSRPQSGLKYIKNDVDQFLENSKARIVKQMETIAWSDFNQITSSPAVFKLRKSNDYDQIKLDFLAWSLEYDIKKNLIYIFWNKNQAIYIGRSTQGIKRPADHITRYWTAHVNKIEIYSVNNKRNLSQAECLANHLFAPVRNLYKPSHTAYYARCIVCQQIKIFNKEIKQLLG